LGDPTGTLLHEIAAPEISRRQVAQTYRLAMESSEPTDWPRVNRAILKRWSLSGLAWIKRQAHSGVCFKRLEGKP
jgi:hypothetical protein